MAVKEQYETWLEPDGLMLLEGWARDGLTDEGIARNCGVAATTLLKWKNRFPQIAQALKKGKELADYQVENALLQSALDGSITAQLFWLKNRRPDKWRDKPPEPTGPKDTPIEDALSQSLMALGKELTSDDQ